MNKYGLDKLQKISMSLMAVLVIMTFIGSNLQAVLWKSSDWLVSTVLPAVVVELTNEERKDNNAAPLRRNATLDAAAQMKAQHMARNEYFAHFAPDGTSPWYWFDEAGYTYAHAGENLAIHFTDSEEVVDAWMKSPSHRKNIVDGKFTEIGVGTAKGEFDGFKTVYVVQLFGTPAASAAPAPTPTPTPAQSTAVAVAEIEPTREETVLAAETELVPEPVTEETVAAPEETEPTPTEANVAQYSEQSEAQVVETENLITQSEVRIVHNDTIVVESPTIATSSGLAVASIENLSSDMEPAPIAGLATRPHLVLEIMYALIALVVIGLLVAALIIEARKVHPVQVAYSASMLAVMALLLWTHETLVGGAVII